MNFPLNVQDNIIYATFFSKPVSFKVENVRLVCVISGIATAIIGSLACYYMHVPNSELIQWCLFGAGTISFLSCIQSFHLLDSKFNFFS